MKIAFQLDRQMIKRTDANAFSGAHTHTAKSRSLTTPLLQPYITCYFWKRTA